MLDREEPARASTTPWRRVWARLDGPAWLLAAGSLALCACFVAVSLAYNDGRLIPPLDDVYIHLHYARQLGSGHPFQYNTGDPVTTGASSLLYALLMGAVWAIGVHGTAFLAAAVAIGIAATAATTVATYRLGVVLGGRTVGLWAGVLTMVSGPLLWGATSGMEVGLVAALTTGTLLAFAVEQPRARFLATPVVGTLLALARPEGLLVALAVCAGMVWTVARVTWADRRSPLRALGPAALACLPAVAGAVQLLVYRVVTGTAQANGVQAKSWLTQGLLVWPLEVGDQVLRNVQDFLAELTGLPQQDLVPPATLPFAVVGLLALALAPQGRSRWRTFAVVVALGLGLVVLSVSVLVTAQWQNVRYLQPFLPVLLLLGVLGVQAVADVVASEPRGRRLLLHGPLVLALVFSLAYAPTWALRLGQQAQTIREAPVTIAHWLRGNVPAGMPIAVNDVGATAYFSEHPTVDLVGLTTNGFAGPANQGAGTLYERLAEMPPAQRPGYFSIYQDWPGVPVYDLERAGVLGDEPVMVFPLRSPAKGIRGLAPPPCQTDRSCDRVDVWQADWSLVGSGDAPDAPVPGRVRDHLNVASLTDEARHAWSPQITHTGLQPRSVVHTQEPTPGREVVDSGRRIVGGETFTLRGLTPGRPAALTTRSDARGPDGDLEVDRGFAVTVDGRPAGTWEPVISGDGWAQSSFTVPAELVTDDELTITTGPRQPFLGPYPEYVSYGYWISQ